MSENPTQLEQQVGALGRRVQTIAWLGSAAWGLLAAAGVLAAAVWLDLVWELPAATRVAALVAAGVALPLVAIALLRLGAALRRPEMLARQLDTVSGGQGQIVAGWELKRASAHASTQPPNTSPAASPLTAGMSELAIRRAAQLAAGADLQQAAPWRALRTPSLAVGASALAAGLLVLALPDLAQTEWLRFTRPQDDVLPFSSTKFEVTPGDVQVVYGAGLEVIATSQGPPVDELDLVMVGAEGEELLPMFRETEARWRTALTSLTEPAQYFVRARTARSARYQIGVITTPKLSEVRVRITPPAYTGDPVYQGAVPQDGIVGLPGTRVEIEARSNRPLSGGDLRLRLTLKDAKDPAGGEPPAAQPSVQTITLRPAAEGASAVAGAFDLRSAGRLELSVTDTAGQPSQETFSTMLTLLEDQRPFVRILEPKPMSLATPEAALPVVLAGEDDYGLTRLSIFRSLNDSRHLPADIPIGEGHLRRVSESVYLPLAAYGLQPGDVIKLFARVEDNDPAGAKGFESAMCVVQIISQEEFERMRRARQNMEMLMSRYRMADRHLRDAREQLSRLRRKSKEQAGEKASQERRDELRRMASQMAKDVQALKKLTRQPLPYDLDKNLNQRLERLTRQLEEAQKKLADLDDNEQLTAEDLDKALDEMLSQLEQEQQEFEEQAKQPLEFFEKIFQLIADQNKFVQLYQRQKHLADRLTSLKGIKGKDDPAAKVRMREMGGEQAQIREALRALLDEIEAHALRLPDDDPELVDLKADALKFADAVRASGAAEAMSAAELALAEFDGGEAHAKANEAAEILKKFIEEGQQMSAKGAAKCRFQPQLGPSLGDTIGQMLEEMGLGQEGTGSGQGGYSTRSNTMQNVGLYGQNPEQERQAGQGSQQDQAGQPGVYGNTGRDGDPANRLETQSSQQSGLGQANVPAQYRRRVNRYFERISEEVGKQ